MNVAGLESLGAWVWGASWRAAVVVVVVLGVRLVVGRRMSPRMRCGLWLLVAARLVMVWAPQGSWSLFGVLERMTLTPTRAMNPGPQRTPKWRILPRSPWIRAVTSTSILIRSNMPR